MKMNAMDWIVWILLFVGGLNWGLVGLFKFDLVNSITGGDVSYDGVSTFGMIIYLLVGLAALWSLFSMFTKGGSSGGSMPQQ